jgi:two-component system cell cycle sensor histidine kinase PleC
LAERAAMLADQALLSKQLAASVAELRLANQTKNDFLASMSHELRTPLNAIIGFSDLMRRQEARGHAILVPAEWIEHVFASGERLLGLINDVLDLSKVEAGRLDLRPEPLDLPGAVRDAITALQPLLERKTLEAVMDVPPLEVMADRIRFRQILDNLLSNAIKFTPPGGEIWLKVGWTAAGGQYMSCKDTGPGIPEEEIPIVLSSFGQGSNALKSAEQGAGLGLPIAKSLVDMHNGTFTLKSKVRIGTELIATFPPERVMAALPPLSEPSPPMQPQEDTDSSNRNNKRSLFQLRG